VEVAAAAQRERPAGGRGGRGGGTRTLTVARGVFDGTALTKVEDIIRMPGATTISRMLFLPDGTLLVSTYGEPQQMAQDKMGLSGKILRYNADGTIPKDNPFVGKEGYRPEIYTLGHRSPEGSSGTSRRRRSGSPRWARTAATRSTSSRRAATTAGRSSASAAPTPGRISPVAFRPRA
jgi:hypothetical protein